MGHSSFSTYNSRKETYVLRVQGRILAACIREAEYWRMLRLPELFMEELINSIYFPVFHHQLHVLTNLFIPDYIYLTRLHVWIITAKG